MNMDTNPLLIPLEMRERYLDRRLRDVKNCDLKLLNLDWAYFERLGHQLKGNAASFGFKELGCIANDIESSAKNKDLVQLEIYVKDFKNWFLELKGGLL